MNKNEIRSISMWISDVKDESCYKTRKMDE